VYYGTRQFEIIKDGYRTEKFLRKINPPWYQWPVLDFVSETIYPFEKRDERIIDVELSPDIVVPTDALIRSGEELRAQATRGVAVGQPPTSNSLTPEQLVIPRGDSTFGTPNSTLLGPPVTALPASSIPIGNLPTIFNAPPFSMPAANVITGSSFRPPVP